jgi:hypothetical protein
MTAVQSPGLVMVLKIVKIKLMAATSPAMTAMVVTVVVTVVTMVVVMYMDVQIWMLVTMILMQPWMMVAAKSSMTVVNVVVMV